jgi:hypothetical protein
VQHDRSHWHDWKVEQHEFHVDRVVHREEDKRMTTMSAEGTTRRTFIAVAAVATFGLRCTAKAQPTTSTKRIGVLTVSITETQEQAHIFREALKEAGYQEGRDIAIEWRYAAGSKPGDFH